MRVPFRFALLTVLALASSGALVVIAAAQPGPSRPHEIPGPDTGPSGQKGDLHWFESPASDATGAATTFGPYRVFPPGAQVQNRNYPADPDPVEWQRSADALVIRQSPLYIMPLPGFSERRLSATLRRITPYIVAAEWVAATSRVNVVAVRFPGWRLPIDIYMYLPESIFIQRLIDVGGHPAVVDEPKAARMPNYGGVRVWMDGWELVLSSPDLGQDRLLELAVTLAARETNKPGIAALK